MKDPALRRCSLATRGGWFEMLLWMHEQQDATIRATIAEIAVGIRCLEAEARAIIDQLKTLAVADIEVMSNGCLIITSRRMKRDLEISNARSNAASQRWNAVAYAKPDAKPHANAHANGHAKRDSDSDTELDPDDVLVLKEGGAGETIRADAIYAAYPRKVGKAAALKAIERAITFVASRQKADRNTACAWLLERVMAYADSPSVKTNESQFIPHPSSWFNGGRYDDDPAEWERAKTTGHAHGGNAASLGSNGFDASHRAAKRAREYPEDAGGLPIRRFDSRATGKPAQTTTANGAGAGGTVV